MAGTLLIGTLSGLIFGTLAVLIRRAAAGIIFAPVVCAPVVYLLIWRDALLGHCFFARHFGGESCTAFRSFLSLTVEHAGDAILVAVTHIAIAFVAFLCLTAIRAIIAKADLTSPMEKERARIAADEAKAARLAYEEEVARLTEEITGIPRDEHSQRMAKVQAVN